MSHRTHFVRAEYSMPSSPILPVCLWALIWRVRKTYGRLQTVYERELSGSVVRRSVLRPSCLGDEHPYSKIEHILIGPRSPDLAYVPPTKPYELSELARDLVLLARHLLVPNGRLVFFLPTVNEAYQEVDIRTMLCDGMELVANSLQDFGNWGRRVRVYA
jgi:hypothetical protein